MKNNLDDLIDDIERVIDTPKVLNRDTKDKSKIARYYKINRLAYDIFNSKAGFVHMGISYDGHFKKSDYYQQGKIVSKYMNYLSDGKILELAPGKAATTLYLAKKYPQHYFYGIDLADGQLNVKMQNKVENLKLETGDYHDLTRYDENSFDLVYIIEALCYSHNREKVLLEVKRVLKPNGYFIVFDGYYKKPESELNKSELKASKLLFTSMMVKDSGHYYGDFKKEIKNVGLKIVLQKDFSDNIMPTLKRFEKYATIYFKHPYLAKTINRIFPEEFIDNAIAGYLFPNTIKNGIFCYKLTIVKKQ